MLLLLGAGEALSWRSARRAAREDRDREATLPGRESTGVAGSAAEPLREYVVVLGYGNGEGPINARNRWRTRVGLRSTTPGARTVLVLSGGSVHGSVPEARLLADHARSLGWDGPMLLDEESISTWENIRNVIPLLQDADRIVIASDPLHAERARAFLAQQSPQLAARLAPARNHRAGEHLLRKPGQAVTGLEGLRRARRDGQIPPRSRGRGARRLSSPLESEGDHDA